MAAQDYEPPKTVSPSLAKLDYQQYRAIRFRPEAALWRGESLFEIQFLHPGFLYLKPIDINSVGGTGEITPLEFDPRQFDYGKRAPLENDADTGGFSGFRVHYPLNSEEYRDEVVVFQGATYFRLVGPGQVYGLSGRGLAIDTAEPTGEEFPAFREFWLAKPGPASTRLVIVALLDSPTVTGAYRFELMPGAPTRMDVEARIFARRDVKKLGIGPMTSMFFYGENRIKQRDDYRPEVHDSDGLLLLTGTGEWIWRPLNNPSALRISAFLDVGPKGFGLVQRDRRFANYQDTESEYWRRPSLWLVPQGEWGRGHVELVEIPTPSEVNDNIVAYWVPDDPLLAGEQRRFRYRLRTFGGRLSAQDKAQVIRTRVGWGAVPDQDNPPPRDKRQFIVDFAGGGLENLSGELALDANLRLSAGSASDVSVTRLPTGEGWRVAFKLSPTGDKPVDMRLSLHWRDQTLSETWTYVWYPIDV